MKQSPGTTTIRIKSQLLKPYRQVAKILGIPTASYLENYLAGTLSSDVGDIAEEFCSVSYPSQKNAEAAAERFEAYAIEEKLGNPDISTFTTNVVERSPGNWSVKVSYLFRGRWKLITTDLWDEDGDDDRDESESWKKDC
jgi:hypothetical protein